MKPNPLPEGAGPWLEAAGTATFVWLQLPMVVPTGEFERKKDNNLRISGGSEGLAR